MYVYRYRRSSHLSPKPFHSDIWLWNFDATKFNDQHTRASQTKKGEKKEELKYQRTLEIGPKCQLTRIYIEINSSG